MIKPLFLAERVFTLSSGSLSLIQVALVENSDRYLSDYAWFNIFLTQMRFPSSHLQLACDHRLFFYRLTPSLLAAKHRNRLLQAGGALGEVVGRLSDMLDHPGIVMGHYPDTGDGLINQAQGLGLLLGSVSYLLNKR